MLVHDTMEAGAADAPIDWLGIGAAVAAISAVGLALGLGLPLLSTVLAERGVSSTMIGANGATAGIASLVAAPLVTPIARRVGVARAMLVSILASAAAAIGFYLFESLPAWFALRVVFHFAVTVLFILSEFWINAASPPHRRGLVLGVYATVLSLGFAIGPMIFAAVGSKGIAPFAIGAVLILAAALPVAAAWSRAPTIGDSPGRSNFWAYVVAVPTATGAVFVFGAVEGGGFALFPVYGAAIGYDQAAAALLLSAIGLGNVLLQVPIGLLSDRFSDRRPLLAAFAACGLAGTLALPALAGAWWPTAFLLFLWGGIVAGLYTVGLAHLGSKLKGADLATANAAFIFCYAGGMLAGPQALGGAMDGFGPSGYPLTLAVFFGAYLLLTLARLARPGAA